MKNSKYSSYGFDIHDIISEEELDKMVKDQMVKDRMSLDVARWNFRSYGWTRAGVTHQLMEKELERRKEEARKKQEEMDEITQLSPEKEAELSMKMKIANLIYWPSMLLASIFKDRWVVWIFGTIAIIGYWIYIYQKAYTDRIKWIQESNKSAQIEREVEARVEEEWKKILGSSPEDQPISQQEEDNDGEN